MGQEIRSFRRNMKFMVIGPASVVYNAYTFKFWRDDVMRSYEFAIRMELDGEKYYMEQAEKHKNSGLYTIFLTLAKDERKHAQILEDRMKHDPDLSKPHRTMNIKMCFKMLRIFKMP